MIIFELDTAQNQRILSVNSRRDVLRASHLPARINVVRPVAGPPSATTIQGRLVALRPISREDYPQLFVWRSSFDTIHLLNFRRRVASYEEFVRDMDALMPNVMALMVTDRTSKPIGYALAHNINPWDRWCAAALFVVEEYRLRGHGAESALLAADFLFSVHPLDRILTEVYEFASEMLRLIELMGFRQVGFIPDHFYFRDRTWGVHQLMLTRAVWNEQRLRFADILTVQQQLESRSAV